MNDPSLIIGVDFDGTIVKHAYPKIGYSVPHAVATLKDCVARGARIILFTMRSGDELRDAVAYMAEQGIPLYGVNSNPDQHTWTTSPKAYCHVYVDDAALGCPVLQNCVYPETRPFVDWMRVAPILRNLIEERRDNPEKRHP